GPGRAGEGVEHLAGGSDRDEPGHQRQPAPAVAAGHQGVDGMPEDSRHGQRHGRADQRREPEQEQPRSTALDDGGEAGHLDSRHGPAVRAEREAPGPAVSALLRLPHGPAAAWTQWPPHRVTDSSEPWPPPHRVTDRSLPQLAPLVLLPWDSSVFGAA